MPDRVWRIGHGIAALILWSVIIGVPVVLFHTKAPGLVLGEHIHAAILFIASQLLVFWLAARPSTRPKKPIKNRPVKPVGSAIAPTPQPATWQAELVANRPATPATGSPFAEDRTVKVTITNYIGSSRPRRVSIEPGDGEHTLLPGQELEVMATGSATTPTFRIVESDLVTQISVIGVDCTVSVVVGTRLTQPN